MNLTTISDATLIARSDAARKRVQESPDAAASQSLGQYRAEIQRRFKASTDLGASLGFIDGVEYP